MVSTKFIILFAVCCLTIANCKLSPTTAKIVEASKKKRLQSRNLGDDPMCISPIGGGAECLTDADCNTPNGTCVNGSCECEWELGWTGPDCSCNSQVTCQGRGECDPGSGGCRCTFPYHGPGCEFLCEEIWEQPQIQPHNETHYGYGVETFLSEDLLYSFTAAIDFAVDSSYLQLGVVDFWGTIVDIDTNATTWNGKYVPPELIEWYLWVLEDEVQWPNGALINFYTHVSDEVDHPGSIIFSDLCDPFYYEYWDSVQVGIYEELGYSYPIYEHIIKFRCFLSPFFTGEILMNDRNVGNGETTYWMSMQAFYETGNVPENYTWGWTLQPLTMDLSPSVIKYTTTLMNLGEMTPGTWYELLWKSEHPSEGDPADLSVVLYNCTPISEICDRDYCSEHGEGDWDEIEEICECICDTQYDGPICQCGDVEDCSSNGTVSWNASTLQCQCTCDEGHDGPTCQCSDVDDCSGHGTSVWAEPCTCQCDEGWRETDCSIPDWCIDDLCYGHGTVTWNETSQECNCTCDSGWDEVADNCSVPNTCQNDEFCNSHGNASWNITTQICTCSCDHGWVGDECDTEATCIDEEWCNGHGTAMLVEEDCICLCFFGWSGEWCDQWDGYSDTANNVIIILLSIVAGLLVLAILYCNIILTRHSDVKHKSE